MYSNKCNKKNRIKKALFIFVFVIVFVFILCILQYVIYFRSNPLKKNAEFYTVGYLFFDKMGNEYESVSVDIKGENLNYIFHNKKDAIQGDIFVNGYSIFGNERNYSSDRAGFYSEFDETDYTTVDVKSREKLCEIISLTKDWGTIVCGVTIDSNISQKTAKGLSKKGLLIITNNGIESAKEALKDVSLNSEQMNRWLTENNWIADME